MSNTLIYRDGYCIGFRIGPNTPEEEAAWEAYEREHPLEEREVWAGPPGTSGPRPAEQQGQQQAAAADVEHVVRDDLPVRVSLVDELQKFCERLDALQGEGLLQGLGPKTHVELFGKDFVVEFRHRSPSGTGGGTGRAYSTEGLD